MKFIKTIAIACVAMISASAAHAEDYNTIGVSYTNTTLTPKYGDSMGMNGFSVGYTRGFGISDSHPMFIEAGLKFSALFHSESEESIDAISTLCSFTVPVSFAWKFELNDKFSIKPYAGLNLKVHVLGKTTFSDEDESLRINWFDKEDMGVKWNRAQVGWHIGADFQYTEYSLGLSYGTDFNQITKKTNSGTFNLTLGYNF